MDKAEFKRYAISSLYTFVAGFLMAILPILDTLKAGDAVVATVLGLIGVGIRGGVKMLGESFLVWRESKKS